jgi:hypothetical protein
MPIPATKTSPTFQRDALRVNLERFDRLFARRSTISWDEFDEWEREVDELRTMIDSIVNQELFG